MRFLAPHPLRCVTYYCRAAIVARADEPIYGGRHGGHCAEHRTKWDTVPVTVGSEWSEYPPTIDNEAFWAWRQARLRRMALRETA